MDTPAAIFAFAFAVTVLYAVVGNLVVYVILVRRRAAVRHLWVGVPGYLYRVCVTSNGLVGARLTKFALSTDIAAFLTVPLVIGLMVTTQ
jgi:hypothetical protein